jgi:SNF2 family DNA or RNA helicase
MLIVPNKQAIVLKADNPEQVLSCIPTAKQFTFKGQRLLYIPHRLDETKILRNLGANVPSPMGYYYDWPKARGRYDPYAHQRVTSEFLTFHKRAAILNAPRTGKTLSCLWTADYLMAQQLVRKVLIVAPLSTIKVVWGDEIFSSFWLRSAQILHGSKEKRLKMLKQDADFYIVNHDGFAIIKNDLPDDIDLVIYDEAAVLRNPSTMRFKVFNQYVAKKPSLRLWLLTGMPTPNEPTDAWALCKLLGADVPRYTLFREMVMMKVSQWTWVPRATAQRTVSEYLQPSIRYTRDECFDLPETVFESRSCELTPHQRKAYNDVLKQFASEIHGHQVTAVNEASKVQKLLQILLGVVYTDDGERAFIDCSSRIDVIKEIINECDEKVIVFVPFTGALDALANALREQFTVETVNGQVSINQRTEIFRAFQTTPDPRVLVADARTMSHGLDLTAATTIIWAGPSNSNDVYNQANDRIKGVNQKHKTSIVHIEATETEARIFKRLKTKQNMQGVLLEIIENQEM